MMADLRATNRAMFWRIIRRLLGANRGRVLVILLALGAGAAITAALLNLQVDAKRRLTSEFLAFGSNVIVAPRNAPDRTAESTTLEETLLDQVPATNEGNEVVRTGFLYLVADVTAFSSNTNSDAAERETPVVVTGYTGGAQQQMLDSSPTAPAIQTDGLPYCNLGARAASQLHVKMHDKLVLRNGKTEETCSVWYVLPYGGQEDNQIFVNIRTAQHLAGLPGRLSLVQATVLGTPQSIERYVAGLQQRLPNADVRPIRQFTEGEAKIYNRISGLLTATVGIVLLLTGLCVMAAMTNVAMERKMDVGLMKAIGGSVRRVLRLFLVEAALLGIAGGLIGGAAGIFLSIGLGKAVFGVAARPRLIVYPISVGLTVFVAILSAFPLRRLASIRPASLFRGEA
jgi:putative ABC transport system permease protein